MKHRVFKRYKAKKHGGQRYWVVKRINKNFGNTPSGKNVDKIKGFEFDKEGNIKLKEKKKPPVIFKGMEQKEEEDGWEDERGNFIINPKEEELKDEKKS